MMTTILSKLHVIYNRHVAKNAKFQGKEPHRHNSSSTKADAEAAQRTVAFKQPRWFGPLDSSKDDKK